MPVVSEKLRQYESERRRELRVPVPSYTDSPTTAAAAHRSRGDSDAHNPFDSARTVSPASPDSASVSLHNLPLLPNPHSDPTQVNSRNLPLPPLITNFPLRRRPSHPHQPYEYRQNSQLSEKSSMGSLAVPPTQHATAPFQEVMLDSAGGRTPSYAFPTSASPYSPTSLDSHYPLPSMFSGIGSTAAGGDYSTSSDGRTHSRRPSSTALSSVGVFPHQVRDLLPGMQQQDIDRLAQSIVFHMRGRDPGRNAHHGDVNLEDLIAQDPPPPFREER